MRTGVWSASSPSYKEYHGGARTAGNGGCPRLIFCLPFKDEDDNHGDDDDRRNLSPSGSHYVSNLQATTADDGGAIAATDFEDSFPHFRSFKPAIDSERIVERALKVCLSFASFSTLSGLTLTSHF